MDAMKILGSKARLEILHMLSQRDMYVSEMMEEVGMDGKTAKHHLNVLEEADLVSSRVEGRRKYYSLVREVILNISPSEGDRFHLQFPEVEGD